MGRQVHVHVVGSLHAAHQLAVVIQGLGVLFVHQLFDLSAADAFQHLGHDVFADHRVGSQFVLCGGHKVLIQMYQLEHVAHLHQQQEFILGHDLAELAVALGVLHLLAHPGLLVASQLFRRHVADVCLVGQVAHYILIGADVVGELLQIFRIGVDDHLCRLCGAGVQHHIGRVHQHIACAFDYAVHFVHCLSINIGCRAPA